jgi:hypothetical protein
MEPEGSLLHSQVPDTFPYPQQARSSPYPHFSLLENPSQYFLHIYAWVTQVASFTQVSTNKTLKDMTALQMPIAPR